MSDNIKWSSNEEDYSYESLAELIDCEYFSISDDLVGQTVYYGEAVPPSTQFITATDIIDMISEQAYDQGGEYSEDYPDCSPQDIKDLEEFITEWQNRFTPRWWTVKNVKEYILTEEDLKEHISNE